MTQPLVDCICGGDNGKHLATCPAGFLPGPGVAEIAGWYASVTGNCAGCVALQGRVAKLLSDKQVLLEVLSVDASYSLWLLPVAYVRMLWLRLSTGMPYRIRNTGGWRISLMVDAAEAFQAMRKNLRRGDV